MSRATPPSSRPQPSPSDDLRVKLREAEWRDLFISLLPAMNRSLRRCASAFALADDGKMGESSR